jgi:hypothetical protein
LCTAKIERRGQPFVQLKLAKSLRETRIWHLTLLDIPTKACAKQNLATTAPWLLGYKPQRLEDKVEAERHSFCFKCNQFPTKSKRISTKKKAHLVARPVHRVFKTESAAADRQRQTDLERRRVKTRQQQQQSRTMMQQQQRSSSQPSIRREKKGSVLVPRFGTSFHLSFKTFF